MQNPLLTNLSKPTKSVYKGVIGQHNAPWNYHNELTKERLLSLLSIILLPVAIGLFGASIARNDLFVNEGYDPGDGTGYVGHGTIGYKDICFTGVDDTETYQPEQCATIDSSCNIDYSQIAQQFQIQWFGSADTQLHNCAEFNGYRATVVMALIFSGIAFLAMIIAHLRILPSPINSKVKIFALVVVFFAFASGVTSQCVAIDWWYSNQQYLATLGKSGLLPNGPGTSTPLYNVLSQAMFDLVGGWVCAVCSFLAYIVHFPSAVGK